METNNSKHIKEETLEGQKDEHIKERGIQELEDQIAELKEKLNTVFHESNRLLTEQSEQEVELFTHDQVFGEPGSVHKTEEEEIEQLTKKLNEANITINNLQRVNRKLRKGKDELAKRTEADAELAKRTEADAELAKAELEKEAKELRQTIYQLERALKRERKSLQDLQRKGHLCNKDCGLCCLLWICNKKLGLYPCGPHLRTIITLEADRSDPIIENKYLRCEAFMSILKIYKVVDIYPKPEDPKRPEMDDIHDRYCNKDKAWEKLMGVDEKERAVIIGSLILKADEVGHCVVCDLETDAREKGRLTIHDPQQVGLGEEVKEDYFRRRVKDYDGVVVFTVNFKKLERIIKDHEKSLMHETSENCETNLTSTDNNRMSPVSPTVTESPEEPKIIELPAESTVTKLPVESTFTELPVEPNMQPAAQDMFPEEP